MRHAVKEEIALRAQHDRRYYQSLAERLFPQLRKDITAGNKSGDRYRSAEEIIFYLYT